VRARLVKGLVLAVLVAASLWFYRATLRPDPRRMEDWAERALVFVFGEHVTYDEMQVDLLSGVTIENLRVEDPSRLPGRAPFWADHVKIEHDVLAMTTGILRLRRLTLVSPQIFMHETEDGDIELDFPFELPEGESGEMATPAVSVTNGRVLFRAARSSRWFRGGDPVVLEDLQLSTTNAPSGRLEIEGSFRPTGLGVEATIRVGGTADPDSGLLNLHAIWDPLYLRPALLEMLAPDIRKTIQDQEWEEGPHSLTVAVVRDPGVEAGRLRVVPRFRGKRRMDVAELPGAETIDARTREQINELFGRIELDVELSGDRIDIAELTTSLGSARLEAKGRIEEGGEVVSLDLNITGLELTDPALRRGLGALGDRIFSEFSVTAGTLDATVHLGRNKGEPFTWSADVFLHDATMAYLGTPDPVKRTPWGTPLMDGFPYAMEHAEGHIEAKPGEIRIDSIEGRHGAAIVRVRGFRERSLAGGETGFVRWEEGKEATIRITVEATRLPVDADLREAVRGSEFADALETYRIGGTVDRVLVDVFKDPSDPKAFVDLDIEMADETFSFAGFPVSLADLDGRFSLRRPREEGGGRGKEFRVRAEGAGAGGRISVDAEILESRRRGRVRVGGRGLELEGDVTRTIATAPVVTEDLRAAWRYLAPRGRVDVSVDVPVFDDPGPERYEVALREGTFFLGAERAGTCPCLTDVEGRVLTVGDETRIEGIRGVLEGARVSANGTIRGGPGGRWDLTVDADDLRLSDSILATIHELSAGRGLLPPGFAIRPGGRMDLVVRLARDPGDPAFRAEVDAKDLDITVNVGALPVRVRGGLAVAGGDVRLQDLTAEGAGVRIEIPSARVTDEGLVGTARARLTDVEAGPEVLSLLPEEVRGTIAELTKDRVLDAVDLVVTAVEGGETTIRGRLGLAAKAGAAAGGGPRGSIDFDPLVLSAPDAEGVRTLRGTLRFLRLSVHAGVPVEDVTGEMTIPGLRLGDAPSGDARLRVRSARVGGLLVEGLETTLAWKEGALRVAPLRGSVYGGTVEGHVVVRTEPPDRYEGRAAVRNLSIERLFEDVGGDSGFRGTANLEVEFQSPTGTLADLVATGRITAVCADLGELPIVANLPALFAGIMPGARKPKFTHADASFTVADEVLHAHSIVLRGPLFVMRGCGTLDSSGWLDLTFEPEFLKQLLIPGVMTTPVLREMASLLPEYGLYVAQVRGHVSDPQTTLVPVPYFTKSAPPPPLTGSVPPPSAPRPVPRWFR
jgi:hypothetical protein